MLKAAGVARRKIDPQAMSKQALIARLEELQWAARLQGLMLEHPVVDGFVERNSSFVKEFDAAGRVLGTRVRFRKDYVMPPIPESRLEALELRFAAHVTGILPSTRRRHAKELVAIVREVLCSDPAPPAPGEEPAYVIAARGPEAEGAEDAAGADLAEVPA